MFDINMVFIYLLVTLKETEPALDSIDKEIS